MTTQEKNEVIAKWMGYNLEQPRNLSYKYWRRTLPDGGHHVLCGEDDLRYHYDWNQLMDACKKWDRLYLNSEKLKDRSTAVYDEYMAQQANRETMKTELTPHLFSIICPIQCGVQIMTPQGIASFEGITSSGIVKYFFEGGYFEESWHRCKPILRKLESMTEEERKEYNNTLGEMDVNAGEYFVEIETPNTFLFLISRSFDLFNLIDSGHAIEKK